MIGQMSEEELLTAVLEMARLLGVKAAHFRPAKVGKRWMTAVQGDGKGFPDLVLAGPGGVLFVELKASKGRLSKEQAVWLETITAATGLAQVWRPEHLRSGLIQGQMRKLARKPT